MRLVRSGEDRPDIVGEEMADGDAHRQYSRGAHRPSHGDLSNSMPGVTSHQWSKPAGPTVFFHLFDSRR
jgi:hypothetical protein